MCDLLGVVARHSPQLVIFSFGAQVLRLRHVWTCFSFRKLGTLLLVSELREVYFSSRIHNDRDTSLSICSVVIKTMVVDVLHNIFLLYFSFMIQNASDTSFYFYFIESNIVHGRSM